MASPHTCAVPLLRSQSKAAVAATLETPDGVPAIPVGAETLEHFALVHICRQIGKKTTAINLRRLHPTKRRVLGFNVRV